MTNPGITEDPYAYNVTFTLNGVVHVCRIDKLAMMQVLVKYRASFEAACRKHKTLCKTITQLTQTRWQHGGGLGAGMLLGRMFTHMVAGSFVANVLGSPITFVVGMVIYGIWHADPTGLAKVSIAIGVGAVAGALALVGAISGIRGAIAQHRQDNEILAAYQSRQHTARLEQSSNIVSPRTAQRRAHLTPNNYATRTWGGGHAINTRATTSKWVSTGDKASVKDGRGKPASLKTVYRNTASGELRVRKMVARPGGNKRVSYVKF
jgi:hypothetical protein